MSASYDPTLPQALDRARFRLGDTTVEPEASALLPDETYATLLSAASTENEAIALAADALASRYAQEPDSLGVGDLKISWKDRVKTWQALAAALRGVDTAEATAGSTVIVTQRPRRRGDWDAGDCTEYTRDLILSEGTWYSS